MKYRLQVTRLVDTEIVVDAPDSLAAMDLADRLVPDKGNRCALACSRAPDDARLSTYTCGRCGVQDLKENYGPGRVTCKACGEVELAACEVTQLPSGVYVYPAPNQPGRWIAADTYVGVKTIADTREAATKKLGDILEMTRDQMRALEERFGIA